MLIKFEVKFCDCWSSKRSFMLSVVTGRVSHWATTTSQSTSPKFTFCQAGDELCFSVIVSPWWLCGSIIIVGPGSSLTVWHWVTLSNGISVKIIVTILCTDKSPIKYNVILMPSISSYSLNTDEKTQTMHVRPETTYIIYAQILIFVSLILAIFFVLFWS